MAGGEYHIGTGGWNFPHWSRGVFYSPRLLRKDWLSYYGKHFSTVELDQTFYQLPPRERFQGWRRATPSEFLFSVQVSRYVTHVKRLQEPEKGLARFLGHVAALGEKMGPLLFQFPASWGRDLKRFDGLLEYLAGQRILPRLRVAFEFRDPTWFCPEVFRRLERGGHSICEADWPEYPPEVVRTAPHVYVRRHGPSRGSSRGYSAVDLQAVAERIRRWTGEGREVFVYFNNDGGGYALRDAQRLRRLLED